MCEGLGLISFLLILLKIEFSFQVCSALEEYCYKDLHLVSDISIRYICNFLVDINNLRSIHRITERDDEESVLLFDIFLK